MTPRQIPRIFTIALAFSAAPLAAHHSVRAAFNPEAPVTFTGTVTAVEWINPHVLFVVETTNSEGDSVAWTFETPSPNALDIKWGFGRGFLKAGDQVKVEGWPALDGSPRADTRVIELPDGQRIEFPESNWMQFGPTQSVVITKEGLSVDGVLIYRTPGSSDTGVDQPQN